MANLVNVKNLSKSGDAMFDISAGLIIGLSGINKFGRNTDIGITEETMWSEGGVWIPPTQARIHQLVSTDAGDDGDPAGVGARVVRIWGLTSWSDGSRETFEDVVMNGTTDVPTINSYVIIHRMLVVQHGNTANNVGAITATADTDATVTAAILPVVGQTEMAVYGIPEGQTAFITKYNVGVRLKKAASFDASLKVELAPAGPVVSAQVKHNLSGNSVGTSNVEYEFKPYARFQGPCIVSVAATADSVGVELTGGFDLIVAINRQLLKHTTG